MSLIVLRWLIIMLVWSIEGCFWSFCGGLVWRCGRWGVDGVRFFFLEICLGGWFADSFFFFCYRFLSIVERAVRLWAISLFPSALSPLHPFLPFFLRLSLFYCFFFFPLQHNATPSVEMISKQTPRPFLYPYPYPSYHLCIPLSSTLIGVLTDDRIVLAGISRCLCVFLWRVRNSWRLLFVPVYPSSFVFSFSYCGGV